MAAQDNYTWNPDWWSRLMALGSLLVAGVALWYARFELPDKMIASRTDYGNLVSQLEQDRTQYANLLKDLRQDALASTSREERFEQICRRLEILADDTESVAVADRAPRLPEANEEPSDLLELPDSAQDTYGSPDDLQTVDGSRPSGSVEPGDPDADIQPDESDMAGDPPGRQDDDALDDDGNKQDPFNAQPSDEATDTAGMTADTAGMTADTAGMTADSEPSPSLLKVVRSALRPLESEQAVTMTIRNVGQKSAVVSQIRFEPVDIIEDVPTELAAIPLGPSTSTELVLVMEATDNLSQSKDRQGIYVHTLSEPYTIPAGQQVDMRLAIRNPDHLGFGLLGRFRLEFNVSESLELPNLAVAFVGKPSESE